MVICMLGATEIILICVVILLIFGGKKLPELMKGMGKGVKSFKEGMNEPTDEELNRRVEEEIQRRADERMRRSEQAPEAVDNAQPQQSEQSPTPAADGQ